MKKIHSNILSVLYHKYFKICILSQQYNIAHFLLSLFNNINDDKYNDSLKNNMIHNEHDYIFQYDCRHNDVTSVQLLLQHTIDENLKDYMIHPRKKPNESDILNIIKYKYGYNNNIYQLLLKETKAKALDNLNENKTVEPATEP